MVDAASGRTAAERGPPSQNPDAHEIAHGTRHDTPE